MVVEGLKVRAVTRFVVLTPDQTTWPAAITAASCLCGELAAQFSTLGSGNQCHAFLLEFKNHEG